MNDTTNPFPSAVYSPRTFVLAGRIAAGQLHNTPRFLDDAWDLSLLAALPHEHKVTLTFLTIPAAFRTPVKEFFATLLLGAPGVSATRARPNTLNVSFLALRSLTTFLDSEGLTSFGKLDDTVLGNYFDSLWPGRQNWHARRRVLHLLHQTRDHSSDPMPQALPAMLAASPRQLAGPLPRVRAVREGTPDELRAPAATKVRKGPDDISAEYAMWSRWPKTTPGSETGRRRSTAREAEEGDRS